VRKPPSRHRPCSVCAALTDGQQEELQQARAQGLSFTQLARRFPTFSRSSLYRHLRGRHRERPITYCAFDQWRQATKEGK